MSDTFDSIWGRLLSQLAQGQKIRNWGIRGYTGNQFTVVGTERNAILVRSHRTGNERRIGKTDFENVYRYYPELLAGNIGRHELGQKSQSRNTSYILSLLRWDNANG